MSEPFDLKNAVVMLSNDDGIHAQGIKVLEKAIRPHVKEVWVAAPETEQSGAGHSLSLRRPLRIRKVSGRRYAIDGTPTDAVLLGVSQLFKKRKPDLILSGINAGANLGEDVTYSGTVSAAFEGTLLGIRSIALSQLYRRRHDVRWATSAHWAVEVIRRVTSVPWAHNVLLNVNFPNLPADEIAGIEVTRQGRRKLGGHMAEGEDPRGEKFYWIGAQRANERYDEGSDLEAVRRGAISVTPLSLELSHQPTIDTLRKVLG